MAPSSFTAKVPQAAEHETQPIKSIDINGVTQDQVSKLPTGLELTRLYVKLAKERKPEDEDKYKYDDLRPSFPDIKWGPLEEVEYKDVALRADPTFKNLVAAASRIEPLTPKFGTVVHGLSLASLNDAQRDELALLVAERGVVFFRSQADLDIKKQLELGRHWGPLHRHATTALPKASDHDEDLLDVHVIWGDEKRVPTSGFSQQYLWHSDVSYEKQPPGYTSLKVLQGPPAGGDTLWSSGYALYDQLSPALQKYLEGLTALHSAKEQADDARRVGKPVRREPVVHEHPLVRTHPVTGYKAVYINPGFTRTIKGVPAAEGTAILNYLFLLVSTDVSSTVRWKWGQDDVAIWDNRVTMHTASWGFYPYRRHAVRVTTTGEAPNLDPAGKSQQQEIDRELGIVSLDKDGSHQANYND